MEAIGQLFSAAYQFPQYRTVVSASLGDDVSTLPDGTIVHSNSEGQIIQAQYASGMKIKRNDYASIVQTVDGSYFYGDRNGSWYCLD